MAGVVHEYIDFQAVVSHLIKFFLCRIFLLEVLDDGEG